MKSRFEVEKTTSKNVAPLAGARIEILMQDPFNLQVKSLPSRERGLKSYPTEIIQTEALVAPLAGARIEIYLAVQREVADLSLPSRERGLKFKLLDDVLDMSRRSPRGSAD